MDAPPPVAQTVIAVLDNQVARTVAALKDLPEGALTKAPPGKTRSILEIGRHLLSLRKMQLKILESALIARLPSDPISSVKDLRRKLALAARLLRLAVMEHDAEELSRNPKRPREGVWGDRPVIVRLARSLNDFTSHLGDIRTIRGIFGDPVPSRR